jgi:UDP-2,3-diacylglucosamine pyrophosphatase LpxH
MKPRSGVDPELKTWATEAQGRYIDAVNEHGSIRAAAKALGVNSAGVVRALQAVERNAAQRGYSPAHQMTRPVPDGFKVKGVSTYYDEDGKARGQWVKSAVDASRAAEIARASIEALTEDVRGLAPASAPPDQALEDILCVYPLGDPHFGMYAWARECGEDFDLEHAERLTLGAVDRLVNTAPPSKTAILLPLGDVFHANDQTNQTPAHKHQLDVDSRFVKVLQVGIKTFRHAVLRLLERHERVIVRFVAGNHDPEAVWALAMTIAAYFESEPRVEVDLSPSKFWFYRFGRVLIGATHGDTCKPEALMGVMASDRSEDWGKTKHRFWYCGHVHHSSIKEFPGVTVETFRTLAAKDAYAASHGYRAGRDMRLIVHHLEHGEIERHRCDVAMLGQPKLP